MTSHKNDKRQNQAVKSEMPTKLKKYYIKWSQYISLLPLSGHWSAACVRLSLRQQVVVVVFGPSQPATWSYHTADCQPTAPVRSVSLVQSAGMPYRII